MATVRDGFKEREVREKDLDIRQSISDSTPSDATRKKGKELRWARLEDETFSAIQHYRCSTCRVGVRKVS